MNPHIIGNLCSLTRQTVNRCLPSMQSFTRLPTDGIAEIDGAARKYSTRLTSQNFKPTNAAAFSTQAERTRKSGCLTCLRLAVSECPKLSMPGCRKARSPIKCVKFTAPRECQPNRAPYSSYHECVNKKPLRPAEADDCRCFSKEKSCFAFKRGSVY